MSTRRQPIRQHGQSAIAEAADSTPNPDPGMLRIVGLPVTPSMPNHGDRFACRTNANHLERLAFGVVPWDKYNHRGGEGLFRITAPTLSGWPPSLPNGSHVHLEEKLQLTTPPLPPLRLAGKLVTTAKPLLFAQPPQRFADIQLLHPESPCYSLIERRCSLAEKQPVRSHVRKPTHLEGAIDNSGSIRGATSIGGHSGSISSS